VARALYFGVGVLVVVSLLHERWSLYILKLQSLVRGSMVFRWVAYKSIFKCCGLHGWIALLDHLRVYLLPLHTNS